MNVAKTQTAVESLLEPVISALGYELVDAQVGLVGRRVVIRLLVDRPGGITLGECAELSREVGPHLDVADLLHGSYALEVSSPGIQRPVKRAADFERFRGERVLIRTHELVDGRKTFRGENLGLDTDGNLVVDDRETRRRHTVLLTNIREAHLDPEIRF
ncbi:MAG: ribosome maturation factor RimP [Deferrisomatales bacterium]